MESIYLIINLDHKSDHKWISAKILFLVSKINENFRSLPTWKLLMFFILG